MPLNLNRCKHFIALVLIGDGVMALLRPGHDARAWAAGSGSWRKLMVALNKRPVLTRVIGGVEVAGAVYWALSHRDPL